MDRNFELAANGWISQYSADVKGKIENLLKENDCTPEELAEVINVPVEEIYDILEGEGGCISVETLIKVFMVLGLAVEIKPIDQTPLGGYDNPNPHIMHEREPNPNPFTRHHGDFAPHHDFGNIPPQFRERMEREMPMPPFPPRGNMFTRREEPQRPTSQFATMSRDELTKIIRNKLWDSEIDLNTASNRDLVRFLEEKDRKMKALRKEKEEQNLERDPQVADFVKRMKQNIKDNPQFRSYMKNFLNKLDEE